MKIYYLKKEDGSIIGLDSLENQDSSYDEYDIIVFDSEDPMEKKINNLYWGTYGKDGKDHLKWILLKDVSLDHLINIKKQQERFDMTNNNPVYECVCYLIAKKHFESTELDALS